MPRATRRVQGRLERTHLRKNKIHRHKNITDQQVNRKNISSIYIRQITHLPSGNQMDMELRNRNVGAVPANPTQSLSKDPNPKFSEPQQMPPGMQQIILYTHNSKSLT